MKKTLAILGLASVVLMANPAYAAIITLQVGASGGYVIGEAFTRLNIPGGGGALSDAVIMTNALLDMPVDTRATINGPEYYRSSTPFSSLPAAVTSGGTITTTGGFQFANTASGEWIAITTHPYLYLVGSYDGRNGGTEVWYVGGISQADTIYIPRYAYPTGTGTQRHLVDGTSVDRYQATGFELLNKVPDGGATATLLGLAMIGLGLVRRLKG
jgi:hypothetical protein